MTSGEINTGFAKIKLTPGPDTMMIIVTKEDREIIFNLNQREAEFMADLLNMWAARVEERKI